MAKLVFDMAVTPHWLADGNRFWYTYENNAGRKFYVVDPAKKTKTYVFDAVKLADVAKVPIAAAWTLSGTLPVDNAAAGLPAALAAVRARKIARKVNRAPQGNDGPHAGAAHKVDGDVHLPHCLDDTDVRQTEGEASA